MTTEEYLIYIKTLTETELRAEIKRLEKLGHKILAKYPLTMLTSPDKLHCQAKNLIHQTIKTD